MNHPPITDQTDQGSYVEEQRARGMVDVSSKRFRNVENYLRGTLGADLSPGMIAHACPLAKITCEEARTAISNFGFHITDKVEKDLENHFGSSYRKPDRR